MTQWLLIEGCDACGSSRCAHMTDNETGEVRRFCDENGLDEMVDGYLECALWSSTDETDESGGAPLDESCDVSDVSDDSWLAAVNDCVNFLDGNERDVARALSKFDRSHSDIGHDFWLTRNGHGGGFWDRGMGALGERLSKASKAYGSVHFLLGDDGKAHSC